MSRIGASSIVTLKKSKNLKSCIIRRGSTISRNSNKRYVSIQRDVFETYQVLSCVRFSIWGHLHDRTYVRKKNLKNPIGFVCIIRILVPQEDTCLAQRDARVQLHFSAACSLPLVRYALVVLRDFLSVFDRRSSCATATSSIKEPRRPLDRRFLLCPV